MTPVPSPPIVRLENARARYPSGFSLALGELTLNEGECLWVSGPNGSGKSTLLALLSGLLPLCAGRYAFMGHDFIRGQSRAALRQRRHIGVLLQEPLLLSGTVRDNLLLPLRLAGQSPKTARALLEPWVERFALGELLPLPGRALSVGQTRWVALARALLADPPLLLLDEPFAALDDAHQERLRALLPALLCQPGRARVLVMHDEEGLQPAGAKFLHLENGGVIKALP